MKTTAIDSYFLQRYQLRYQAKEWEYRSIFCQRGRTNMTGIILASHGGLAEGVKQSAGMVFGPQEESGGSNTVARGRPR